MKYFIKKRPKTIIFTNNELLEHFKKAVCDRNYNPTDDDYNKSGYTYDELEAEILNRMHFDNDD